jgi:MoaA/NifB/PqqE/SkfB family radical SAM enzyme
VKGAFERAVNALKFLSQERTSSHQRVNLMCVLNNGNLEDVEGLIQLARRLDANFMVQPYSDLKTGDKAFIPSGPVSAHLLELKKKYPNFISNASFLANFDRALNQGVPGCLAGRAFFNIDNFSRVSICVEDRRQPAGNLMEDDLGDLLQALRKKNEQSKCQACWYNCRGEVEVLYSLKGALRALPPLVFNP